MDNIRSCLETLIDWLNTEPAARVMWADSDMIQPFDTKPAPWLAFFLILTGRINFTVGDQTDEASPGELVVINAHHGNYGRKITSECLYSCLSINIETNKDLKAPAARSILLRERVRDKAHLHSLCRRTCAQYHSPAGLFKEHQLKAMVVETLIAMHEAVQSGNGGSVASGRAIRKALRLIDEHHADPNLKLDDIAKATGVSVGHLEKRFKTEVGTTAMRHLARLRMARARKLLLCTSFRIGEVAGSVGYRDPLYFSRAFHHETGMSPSAFRRAHADARHRQRE